MSAPDPPHPATYPHATATPALIADELARRGYVAVAHEWLPTGIDLAAWRQEIAALCQDRGVLAEFATDLRSSVTIIMNTSAMPTLQQIEHAIAQIRHPAAHGN